MTIERKAARFAGAAFAALAVWFGGVAAAAALFDASSVVVFGPRAMEAALAAGATLVDARPGFVHVDAEEPGLVRRLYASGAWLVWPATAGGCRGRPQAGLGPRPGVT